MNKQDIAIVVLLVALLFGWMHVQNKSNAERMRVWREHQAAIAATNGVGRAAIAAEAQGSAAIAAPAGEANAAPAEAAADAGEGSGVPETTVRLRDDEVELVISSKGGAITSATLFGYRQTIDRDSPDIRFDYSDEPVLAIGGLKGLGRHADFEVAGQTPTSAVLRCAAPSGLELRREITLLPDYQVKVSDALRNASGAAVALPAHELGIGSATRVERSKNALLSVDSLSAVADRRGRLGKVRHWERKRLLTSLFTGDRGGGCAGAPDAAQFAPSVSKTFDEPQKWVALKTRFFALVFASDSAAGTPGSGFGIRARRSLERGPLAIEAVSGWLVLPPREIAAGETVGGEHRIYIGPKKHSVIRKFGEKSGEIMEFGMSKWLCVALLPILNFFYIVFRNYGVAIIVLTILVRLLFWPLTRKSNEGMKKMGAIQPKVKELQEKFKDDPQKLQRETMKFYRENNVNPMASCLPMLIQIPVFIALFVVLRSATELRFAPFLWIRDLSEPENLLQGVLPGGLALNILPFVMAATMFLQSRLTPSMGDPQQQKMMMWMMPLMMFFMFYTMPSALLLYWSVSQLLAIVQLLRQRRRPAAAVVGADGVIEGGAMTRQQRRRMEREGE